MQPDSAHADMPPLALTPTRKPDATGQGARSPDSIPASRLFQGSQEILIGHNGDTYRLRITRNGKLILTK
ncbi:MAG: hemin uptake protein HemP [Thiobacillus sp.]